MSFGRSTSVVLALLAIPLLLGACAITTDDPGERAPQPAPRDADAAVTITDMSFSPATVEIKAGETVAWVWDDGFVTHDVVFDDGTGSPQQDNGTWEHRFPERGSYDYRCTIHSWMTARVIVT
jgi:plastocyanin